MTAIVGVLNRQGVAFAADSAATHSKTHKITNHANKIFSLSKYRPVGLAIYNTLNFIGVPWETLIKDYRQKIGDTSFGSMDGYIDSFWNYLKSDVIPRWTDIQKSNLLSFARGFYNQIFDEAKMEIGGTIDPGNPAPFFAALDVKMNLYKTVYSAKNTCDELNDYTEADIYAYIPAQIDNLLNPLQQMNGCPQNIRDKFLTSMLAILKANENTYTSYFLVKSAETEQCGAAIASFAQTDMAITLMRGIAPDLSEECYKFYGKSIDEFKTELSAQLQAAGAPQALLDIINAIDVANKAQKYRDGIEDFIKINHTDKLLEAIGYLSKEDLADIAENMVSMTYLNRRFTSQEESVGGPVDVAVITKGDGFVWIKRKHYFDASINQQFFERYNK